jgi:hypothetical protein
VYHNVENITSTIRCAAEISKLEPTNYSTSFKHQGPETLLFQTGRIVMPMSLHSLYHSQSQSYVTTDGQSASVLVSGTHVGTTIVVLLLSDTCGFVDMGVPSLTRAWVCRSQFLLSLPALSSGHSSAGLRTLFYCLRF